MKFSTLSGVCVMSEKKPTRAAAAVLLPQTLLRKAPEGTPAFTFTLSSAHCSAWLKGNRGQKLSHDLFGLWRQNINKRRKRSRDCVVKCFNPETICNHL